MGTKKAAATREVSDGELEGVVRALVQRASGIGRTEFKKELAGEYKPHDKRALEMARTLAARHEIYRWVSGASKERFFTAEPFDALGKAVAGALAGGPLVEADLKRRVESEGRGFGDLLKEWLKSALKRGEIFQHPGKTAATKPLGLQPPEPDVAVVFKAVFTALNKALVSPAGKRVPHQLILAKLAEALGLPAPAATATHPASPPTAPARPASAPAAAATHPASPRAAAATPPASPPSATATPENHRDSFIRALRELSAAGPPLVQDLRARVRMDKPSFDRLSLELAREGIVTLHHHDFPTSLSDAERLDMIQDERGTHYVGIALRRSHG